MKHRNPTKDQQRALFDLYTRYKQSVSFLRFRRLAFWGDGDCLMVPWAGMVMGIESDGYTHS